MDKFLLAIIKTARPRQWLKNIALYSAVFLTGHIFNFDLFLRASAGFVAFCFLASSNYFFNDILDAPRDRKHPFKKFRPIANGTVSIKTAYLISLGFAGIGLIIAYNLGWTFFAMATIFVTLQYTYSIILKHISVIDILTITTGYFIRVYAGEAATGYHISVWLALTALSLALFLAVGKRRSEITLLQGYKGVLPKDTRETLTHYSEKLLDTYTSMFANSTFISYAFFTFLEKPSISGFLFYNYEQFSADFASRKWMMISIPFVLFGIMRYIQLIYEGKGESPEKLLTSDKPLLTTVLLWGISLFVVIYGIGG